MMERILMIALVLSLTLGTATGQYDIGDEVKDFTLRSTSGKMVSLSDYDKGVIVVFTSNTCPYAVMYEGRIMKLHTKYGSQGYPVLAINPNDPTVKPGDSYNKMQMKVENTGITYEYVFDDGQKVYPQFGATKTPHVFLLDNEHKVRYIGAIDDNAQSANSVKTKYLEDAIAALQRGESPDPTKTKAIGCTIKTK